MHFRPSFPLKIAFACLLALSNAPLFAQGPPPRVETAVTNELDAFMAKVLAKREVNLKTLDQYVLDEVEGFEIFGPGRTPLHRSKREFTWYVRDGMHVRSPVRFNGVGIGEDAREQYEATWIRQEQRRRERRAERDKENKDKENKKEGGEIVIGPDGLQVSGAGVPTEPRFVSEAYFMEFKFEAGNYYFAGREQLDGQEVLRIEYYPSRMFGDDDDDDDDRARREKERKERGRKGDQQMEQEIERRMNKTALITLWVDPREHQIVKYTFDNVWLDFLPAAWLVRVDDIRASMTMGQPFPGVWLPRGMMIHAGVTLANGSFEAGYEREFSEYRLAEVATKVRIPKRSRNDAPPRAPRAVLPAAEWRPDEIEAESGPFVPGSFEQEAVQAVPEVIGEIRVHGNAFLTDKEVLDLAGVAVGQPLGPGGVEEITRRLKASDRFDTVDVRKRFRSLTSSADVALVLVVHEKPGVRSATEGAGVPGVPDAIGRRAGRLRSKLMFLPILSFADGYGFTYGGRMSTVDLFGIGERLSVPLTWGGTRRAALEFERQFKAGPLTRISSSAGIWNRENPRFEIRDQRIEVKGRAERVFADLVRVGVDASRASISFGALEDRLWTVGTTAAIDTRIDPAFPGNAVLISAGWTGLHFREVPETVNRYTADARGYLRVFRQMVVAGRGAYVAADSTLPPYERLLMGGASSLRGFRTGAFDGDRMLTTSAELRVPLTSVLRGAKLGATAFFDAGKIWNDGQSADSVDWHRGVGGGVFLIASILRINLDVAHGLKTGDTRVHLSSGFTF